MEIVLFFACLSFAPATVISLPTSKQDTTITNNDITTEDLTIVSREKWRGRRPRQRDPLNTPVPHVVIHHTYIPGACNTSAQCEKAMQSMQNYHMDTHGWFDIGYNFCVGGDGKVYEGRGWTTLGAHAAGTNNVSIGICIIGDWTVELPPKKQLDVTKSLIELGLAQGHISKNYTLLGHRQVRNTECPGDKLFKEIQSWDNFSVYPRSHRESLSLARRSSVKKNHFAPEE